MIKAARWAPVWPKANKKAPGTTWVAGCRQPAWAAGRGGRALPWLFLIRGLLRAHISAINSAQYRLKHWPILIAKGDWPCRSRKWGGLSLDLSVSFSLKLQHALNTGSLLGVPRLYVSWFLRWLQGFCFDQNRGFDGSRGGPPIPNLKRMGVRSTSS